MEILLKWTLFGLAGWFFWWAFGEEEKAVELDPNRKVIPDRPVTPERKAQLRKARDEWLMNNNVESLSVTSKCEVLIVKK